MSCCFEEVTQWLQKILQIDALKKLREGHQGNVRCWLWANAVVWWPGLSKQMNEFIKKCPECSCECIPHKEPLIPSSLPEYPWQKWPQTCSYTRETYIIIGYFSQYPEIQWTTSQSVVTVIFSRHGTPETVVSPNTHREIYRVCSKSTSSPIS